MARKDLALLTSRVEEMKQQPTDADPAPVVEAAPVPEAAPEPKAPATAPRKPASRKVRPTPTERTGAIMDEYERKETWLRPDQTVDLNQLAKRLQRAKDPSETTRITANTLIRVAVDALLEHADELQGDTETQIRKSVTSRVVPGK